MSHAKSNTHMHVLILLITLSLIRLAVLVASPINLHGDEAQYWAWSRDLDWGYYSKPPMIAWVIALTTAFFGHAEWAVRLSSVLIHPLTAYILFRTGRFLYDSRTGFWAAALYFLMPAVWLSSGIVSTDVPLLLFWTAALYAWARHRETANLKGAVILGVAIGLGMLSKYAMLFFLPALLACLIIDRKSRRALLSKSGLVVAGIAGLVLLPNLIWNMANDFATLSHTAANTNLKGGVPFHPLKLAEFWLSQFGVFGPLTLPLLGLALWAGLKGRLGRRARLLCLFVLCPLIIISVQALLSRANANWAVTAYMAGALLTARFIVSKAMPKITNFAKAATGVNIMIGVFLITAALIPTFADRLGAANAFKRVRGWPQTQQAITDLVHTGHEGERFTAIATDNRLAFYDLVYYGLEESAGLKLYMWRHSARVHNHAEATASLQASQSTDGPILIINTYEDYKDELAEDFQTLATLPPVVIDLGGGKTRYLYMWAGYGYTPTKKAER